MYTYIYRRFIEDIQARSSSFFSLHALPETLNSGEWMQFQHIFYGYAKPILCEMDFFSERDAPYIRFSLKQFHAENHDFYDLIFSFTMLVVIKGLGKFVLGSGFTL